MVRDARRGGAAGFRRAEGAEPARPIEPVRGGRRCNVVSARSSERPCLLPALLLLLLLDKLGFEAGRPNRIGAIDRKVLVEFQPRLLKGDDAPDAEFSNHLLEPAASVEVLDVLLARRE